MTLSEEHVRAVNRRRRIVVNYDSGAGMTPDPFTFLDPQELVRICFEYIDDPDTQIDSVWWNWGEGNEAYWPSEVLGDAIEPGYGERFAEGVDIVKIFMEETRKRGLEVFFSYRVNGTDMKPYRGRGQIPMKEKHPDWQIDWSGIEPEDVLPYWDGFEPHDSPYYKSPWNSRQGYWNFAVQGVREYKVRILREVAENYEFDGIDIDYARICPSLPVGHQWEHREALTDFMRSVRSTFQEIARKRDRPILLSARVPDTIEGCHFDGIDVETWVSEQLVDILCLGVRSFDVEAESFRRVTAGTHIKLYPSYDSAHFSDGYDPGPGDEALSVMRGVCSNFLEQGADGILAFNSPMYSSDGIRQLGFKPGPDADRIRPLALQTLREVGCANTLLGRDKIFPVQRRGGGHRLFARPENWYTPRIASINSNMLGQLPAPLSNSGKGDTLLHLMVGDDLNALRDRVECVELHLLLSDPGADDLEEEDRIEPGVIRPLDWVAKRLGKEGHYTCPPGKDIADRIEIRINNLLLRDPATSRGWLVYAVEPCQTAVGKNLVSVRVTGRSPDVSDEISVEKLELHVNYR